MRVDLPAEWSSTKDLAVCATLNLSRSGIYIHFMAYIMFGLLVNMKMGAITILPGSVSRAQ